LYYLTGSTAIGVCWLPLEGEAVLAVRKAPDRARLESPLRRITAFHSYRELAGLCAEAGSPLSPVLGVETKGVSWEQGLRLSKHLGDRILEPADMVLAQARARKTPWEIAKLAEAGRRHNQVLRHMLPRHIRSGMSELAVAHRLWDCFFRVGHCGPSPVGIPGMDMFLGYVCSGENGNYPSAYNGPLGVKGVHPSAPFMGNADAVWRENQILAVDTGFNFEGYLTDKTQLYFSGNRGSVPALIREAQDAAERIEELLAARLRPGTLPAELYAESLRLAEAFGFREGFMGLGGNKVPFVGHGIGLTVSEWPILAAGFCEPLEAGMVIALEPKIGLPGIGMVGGENSYLVTDGGGHCLTGDKRGLVCVV
jgi:Xaa-Pro aminopeptidase